MKSYLSQAATEDLAEIFKYLSVHNPVAARNVIAKIRSHIQNIEVFPDIGRTGNITGTREYILPNLPYMIPYRVMRDEVEIIRIYHMSRPPLS